MIAKYNGACKVTGLPIVADVTEITKINGVWQVANAQPVQQAQAQAKPTAKVVNFDEKLTSGKWSGYSLRDLARSFVGREYLEWGAENHKNPTYKANFKQALAEVAIDAEDKTHQINTMLRHEDDPQFLCDPYAHEDWYEKTKADYLQEQERIAQDNAVKATATKMMTDAGIALDKAKVIVEMIGRAVWEDWQSPAQFFQIKKIIFDKPEKRIACENAWDFLKKNC